MGKTVAVYGVRYEDSGPESYTIYSSIITHGTTYTPLSKTSVNRPQQPIETSHPLNPDQTSTPWRW